MSKFTLMFIIVIAFLLVLPAVAFAQDKPPADTPTTTEPVPADEQPTEPVEVPSPLHYVLANLVNVMVMLQVSGSIVMGINEGWKRLIAKVSFVRSRKDLYTGLIIAGALAIGVGYGIWSEMNLFAGFAENYFGSVSQEVAWILSGLAAGAASFITRQQWKWLEAKADQAKQIVDIVEPVR